VIVQNHGDEVVDCSTDDRTVNSYLNAVCVTIITNIKRRKSVSYISCKI